MFSSHLQLVRIRSWHLWCDLADKRFIEALILLRYSSLGFHICHGKDYFVVLLATIRLDYFLLKSVMVNCFQEQLNFGVHPLWWYHLLKGHSFYVWKKCYWNPCSPLWLLLEKIIELSSMFWFCSSNWWNVHSELWSVLWKIESNLKDDHQIEYLSIFIHCSVT